MPSHDNKTFLSVHFEKIRQHSFSGAVPIHGEKEKERPTVSFNIEKPVSHEPDLNFSEEEHYLLINFIGNTSVLIIPFRLYWSGCFRMCYNVGKMDKNVSN